MKEQELKELKELIEKLTKILASPKLQLETVKSELLEIRKRFKVERASVIIKDMGEFVVPTEDDSRPVEDVVVGITKANTVKLHSLKQRFKRAHGGQSAQIGKRRRVE